jgi:large subunit ribosomal protein L21
MSVTAVIASGGKQYIVREGDIVVLETLTSPDGVSASKAGDVVVFDHVLMLDNGSTTHIGADVQNASVSAELIENGRADKKTVIRYRAKSRYFKKKGHRQPYSKVKITSIKGL